MNPISVQNNTCSIFRLHGKDESEQDRFASGTLTIDDVTHCYVAKMPATTDQYIFVSRNGTVAAGATVPVNVTVAGQNDRGIDLATLVIPFAIVGPPLPPPATHFAITEGPFGRDKVGFTPPDDPGSGMISL